MSPKALDYFIEKIPAGQALFLFAVAARLYLQDNYNSFSTKMIV
jgi:hypothetical protein